MVKVYWKDCEPTWGLLLETPEITKKDPDPSLCIFWLEGAVMDRHALYSQVIEVEESVFIIEKLKKA